ncbi:MAG TPA: response regulator transcription factor [Bacillales bacterium]|nr:response regulator transcription factor [Bacillales bacterium]
MSLSLSRQTTKILGDGIQIVRKHEQPILSEWETLLSHLNQKDGKLSGELDLAVDFFSRFLLSNDDENVERWFGGVREAWQQKFQHPPEPNHVIIIVTILENAVHKAVTSEIGPAYQQHQAIQYLFSHIAEQILAYPFRERLNLDLFLKQIASSRQLPIEWIAKVEKTEQGYKINKIIGENTSLLPEESIAPSETLFALSESLLGHDQDREKQDQKIFPIPWNDETLLFCTKQSNAGDVLPFLTFALQTLTAGREVLRFSNQEQQWKDAVILFNEWIMRSDSLNEAIENITFGFVNYLPFERCALFSYSNTDHNSFGLFGYHLNTDAIKNIHENIDNIPSIKKNLKKLQPLEENLKNIQPIYISKALNGFPDHYVRQFQLESVVVAPVYVPSKNKLIGAAILDQGPGKRFKVSHETFTALMKFGQSAGEILAKFGGDHPEQSQNSRTLHLSRREIEVLKLMADGASTTEAAEKLNLSEYTVRDYISAIMQKMNARNRTEAAVKAIRDGII